MFIAEDSLESTIVPRLIRAGADLTKIHFLESVILQNEKRELALTTDMPLSPTAPATSQTVRRN